MTAHARLSASKAERWMECPGSIALSERLPPEESSPYADEGTDAHEFAAQCLEQGLDAYEFAGVKGAKGFEMTSDMALAVQAYLDYVRALPGALMVEHRIEDTTLADFGGTADAIVLGDALHVVDFKYGAGVPVDVTGNVQMRYYAYGVLRSLAGEYADDASVNITIVQPRAAHSDGPIRTEALTVGEIIRWGEQELLPAMARVAEEPDTFHPGSHCQFCPAKLSCPALLAISGEAEQEIDVNGMTDEELADRYSKLAQMRMYIKAIEDEAFARAMQGNAPIGTKLIYGRASREWKEGATDVLLALFGEDAYTDPELKSPAQVEKLPNSKDVVAEWAYKKEGRPMLVSSDKPGVRFDPAAAGAGFDGVPA